MASFEWMDARSYGANLFKVWSRRGSGHGPGWAGQRRFWDHHFRDKADWAAQTRYCWGNPVKHGLVERPADWPWSSVHRDGGRMW